EATGSEPEPRGEDAVVGAGSPASLEVAEDDATGLVARLVLDHLGDNIPNTSEADVAEGVGLGGDGGRALVGELGTFGDDHDVVVLAAGPAPLEDVDDMGDVDRDLGDEDIV